MAPNTRPTALVGVLKRTRFPSKHRVAQTRRTLATVEHRDPEPRVTDIVSPRRDSKPHSSQKEAVRDAKPFSDFLTDTFNRQHDYLRISVTERCNLRCLYCMPEEGIELSPNKELLTTAEIHYLSALFVSQGVNKIRLTGGEPTVRKDIIPLMQQIGSLRKNGLKELALTTNGISLHRKLDQMVEAGLTGVNISLDTLDPFEFQLLTRRQGFDAVMKSINRVHEMNKLGAGIKLKINCVVMRGLNDHQVLPFVEKTREEDIEVRFIEYMPFGGNKWSQNKMLPYAEMLDMIRTKYPTIGRMRDAKNDTSKTWQVPGFKGRVGFITSMTHNFCGTCNRLRITSDGNLKVCLHGNTEVSLRDLLRTERNGEPMDVQAFDAIRQLELDRRRHEGLRFDGEEGWMSKENALLEVIGAAVKRKQAKHAGMGALENMKNRPMILIGGSSSVPAQYDMGLPSRPSSAPWSGIPTHLIAPNPLNPWAPHRRFYSTDCRDKQPDMEGKADERQKGTGLASSFGFQSLASLFQQPRQGRYSSPRTPEERIAAAQMLQTSEVESHGEEAEDWILSSPSELHRQKSFRKPSLINDWSDDANNKQPEERSGKASETPPSQSKRLSRSTSNVPEARGLMTRRNRMNVRKVNVKPLDIRFHEAGGPANMQRLQRIDQTKRGNGNDRVPNPFSPGDTAFRSVNVHHPISPPRSPWGLIEEAEEVTVPSADSKTSVSERPDSGSEITISSGKNILESEPKLTHVTSTGEAHMVDVGAKAATKRVAIAFTTVRFHNSEPFRLINENSNKKGDVLGVARIAGIMASKRTSDLIPLCHPLAITKVEVDIKLEPPGVSTRAFRSNDHGVVTIQAQVECTGPTGVEMEALTAVTGAALTVYDMCKAVDRDMRIMETRVVYKSGGNSGLHAEKRWAHHVGNQYLADHGLQTPINGPGPG